MAFDGIICLSIVSELNNSILNGKINKIFEPNKNELLLGIYNMGKNYALNISIDPINYRTNLTTYKKSNPQNVLNFCMVLRKHLTGGTIKKIYTHGLERVIYIDIDCCNELNDHITKTLVIELMGKHSNVILLNSNNVIIDSLRHLNKFDNSIRDILPGFKYVNITNNKLDFYSFTFDSFYNVMQTFDKSCTLSKAISDSFTGFSSSGVSYILQDLNIRDSLAISLEDLKKVYQYFRELLNSIYENDSNFSCIENFSSDKPDFYITSASKDGLQVNFFIDDFYYSKEITEKFNTQKNNILHLILEKLKKLKNKLNTINSKLNECSKMETYKLYGELITSNLYKINSYNQESITLENYYDNNSLITIPLDSSINPAGNAKKFFKKYKKLQNTYSIVNKQKELIEIEMDYLDSIVYDINNASNITELDSIFNEITDTLDLKTISNAQSSKHSNKSLPNLPTEYKIDNFTVLVGKNNKQNDYLTCKLAKNNDLWFHTKDIHGSHVVLRLDKNITKVPDSIIYKCASIAAFYSKAKLSQNVPVDYTYIKYVKKPNGAKPGMVIYTNNKTLYVNPQNFKN